MAAVKQLLPIIEPFDFHGMTKAQAKDFCLWLHENFDALVEEANDASSMLGRLKRRAELAGRWEKGLPDRRPDIMDLFPSL